MVSHTHKHTQTCTHTNAHTRALTITQAWLTWLGQDSSVCENQCAPLHRILRPTSGQYSCVLVNSTPMPAIEEPQSYRTFTKGQQRNRTCIFSHFLMMNAARLSWIWWSTQKNISSENSPFLSAHLTHTHTATVAVNTRSAWKPLPNDTVFIHTGKFSRAQHDPLEPLLQLSPTTAPP